MSKNVLFDNCKELIFLYLTTGDTLNYAREIKIAKKLLQQYPIEFFRQYDTHTRFHSLNVFLTKSGKKELETEFALYNLTKPKDGVKLEKESVIDISVNVSKKNKNLLEFVDNQEEK